MRLVKLGYLLAVVVLILAKNQVSAQEIKISHQWAEGTDGRDRAARVFVQEVEGRAKDLKFRIYPNSSLKIKPTEVFAALQSNKLEMAIYPLTYAATQVPEFSLAGLPGLVPDLNAAQALKGTEIHEMLQAIAEANGIHIVTWWWAPGGLFAKNRQITEPASVRGLKMRAAEPLFELMLKEAGASISSMPSTDIYTGLQSGSLDAIGTTYEAFMSLRLFEQAKVATLGTSLFMAFCPLVASLETWNRLTAEQKAAVEEAAAISDAYFETVERDLERRVVVALRNAGVVIHRMSKDDYLAWLALAQKTAWVEYTRLNPRAQELLVSSVRTFLQKFADKDDDKSFDEIPKN
ncbi:MAG TPA: TRAP transporter substrate-binding protein DctP [Hyphomicrobiaceae bacterium]|nr:TRAP transporter substrate-binding protein DctP [Hyphomicrobiaceae bacterium]